MPRRNIAPSRMPCEAYLIGCKLCKGGEECSLTLNDDDRLCN